MECGKFHHTVLHYIKYINANTTSKQQPLSVSFTSALVKATSQGRKTNTLYILIDSIDQTPFNLKSLGLEFG